MAKTCGHLVPCGCNDTPLTTGSPCNDGIQCQGNPCAENFCAECIVWCGPGLPNLGIKTGMNLYTVFQLLDSNIDSASCVDDSDSCKAVLLGLPTVTSSTINISFTPISTASQTRTLYLTEVSTGTVTPYAIDTGATEILIEFLAADSEYKLFITSVCADLTECSSAELLIKTLK